MPHKRNKSGIVLPDINLQALAQTKPCRVNVGYKSGINYCILGVLIISLPHNFMETQQPYLGKKTAKLRKARGLTQEELVGKCNLSVRTL